MGRIVYYRLPIIDQLQAHAERLGVSVRSMATRLEVTPSTVSGWYRGVSAPHLDPRLQRRLAAELGISPRRVLELFDLDLSDEPLRSAHKLNGIAKEGRADGGGDGDPGTVA